MLDGSMHVRLKHVESNVPHDSLQAFFLVADDIMDKSITRRGQPCWYNVPEVGMVAINDGILLEQLVYFILKKHLREHPSYVPMLELFMETIHQTAHGQMLDLITAPQGSVDLTKYTMSRCAQLPTEGKFLLLLSRLATSDRKPFPAPTCLPCFIISNILCWAVPRNMHGCILLVCASNAH
jgi:hypothetical protein